MVNIIASIKTSLRLVKLSIVKLFNRSKTETGINKWLILTLACLLSFNIQTSSAQAQPEKNITVLLDNLPLAMEASPVIQNNSTLVPFRAIAEALNTKVTWDGQTQSIFAEGRGIKLSMQINNATAYVNQTPVTLAAPPRIINNRTYLPLRFFSSSFNCDVSWDGANRQVVLFSSPDTMNIIGFYALGDEKTSSWRNLFGDTYPQTGETNTDALNQVALGWYSLDEQGNLLTKSRTGWQRPQGWESVLEIAREHKLTTEMVVHLTDDNSILEHLLSDEVARTTAVQAIAREAELYHGVNLDFEGLGWNQQGQELAQIQSNFTAFVRELSAALKPLNLRLTLSLHPLNSAYPGYDYHELGKIADKVIVMAYEYGTTPEPAHLVQQAVDMAQNKVPADKLILGISVPGETPESLVAKIGIAKRNNWDGIAIWRLGLVSEDMWQVIRNSVIPAK